jgi:hypothetical protein
MKSRGAELHSAVSRICNPQGMADSTGKDIFGALPIANRRYGGLQTCATDPRSAEIELGSGRGLGIFRGTSR